MDFLAKIFHITQGLLPHCYQNQRALPKPKDTVCPAKFYRYCTQHLWFKCYFFVDTCRCTVYFKQYLFHQPAYVLEKSSQVAKICNPLVATHDQTIHITHQQNKFNFKKRSELQFNKPQYFEIIILYTYKSEDFCKYR